jgi:outer membrane protein assembly factor BamB
MRKILGIIILLSLASFSSCNKDNADGGLPTLIWQASTSDGKLINDQVAADVQYDGGVLYDGISEGKPCLYLLNSSDGSVRWRWNDFFSPDEFWATIEYLYQIDNLMLVQTGTKIYCIDLSTGLTKWKKKNLSDFGTSVTGRGNYYYVPAKFYPNGDGTNEGKIVAGNIADGSNETVFLTLDLTRKYIDPNNSKGIVWSCDIVQVGSDLGLLIFFWDPWPNYKVDIFLGLYNLTQNKWKYSKKPFVMDAGYGVGPPVIKNNRVYNSVGKILQCHDLFTGDVCWSITLSDVITSANDGWVDGKILSTTQDRITHCIDPATGKQLWQLTTSGNPSLVSELNGIAYFVGGNAQLFAIDVAAGKILWQFGSPDSKTNSKAFFKQAVRVKAGENGGKGKVMVQSYLNAFCYEAAR